MAASMNLSGLTLKISYSRRTERVLKFVSLLYDGKSLVDKWIILVEIDQLWVTLIYFPTLSVCRHLHVLGRVMSCVKLPLHLMLVALRYNVFTLDSNLCSFYRLICFIVINEDLSNGCRFLESSNLHLFLKIVELASAILMMEIQLVFALIFKMVFSVFVLSVSSKGFLQMWCSSSVLYSVVHLLIHTGRPHNVGFS